MGVLAYTDILDAIIDTDGNVVALSYCDEFGDVILMRR